MTSLPRRAPLVLGLERTQAVVAAVVELALTRRTRRAGLLGRVHLDVSAALFPAPCLTRRPAFMRFPTDLAFVARAGRALRLSHTLRPWGAAMSARAYAAIELPAGTLLLHSVEVGDRLLLTSGPGGAGC